jgi:hypothetical protein
MMTQSSCMPLWAQAVGSGRCELSWDLIPVLHLHDVITDVYNPRQAITRRRPLVSKQCGVENRGTR